MFSSEIQDPFVKTASRVHAAPAGGAQNCSIRFTAVAQSGAIIPIWADYKLMAADGL